MYACMYRRQTRGECDKVTNSGDADSFENGAKLLGKLISLQHSAYRSFGLSSQAEFQRSYSRRLQQLRQFLGSTSDRRVTHRPASLESAESDCRTLESASADLEREVSLYQRTLRRLEAAWCLSLRGARGAGELRVGDLAPDVVLLDASTRQPHRLSHLITAAGGPVLLVFLRHFA